MTVSDSQRQCRMTVSPWAKVAHAVAEVEAVHVGILRVGIGRIIASEKEVPILLEGLV